MRRYELSNINRQAYRFNPRTREGCDCDIAESGGKETSFNPRTREGCDQWKRVETRVFPEFQSTHP